MQSHQTQLELHGLAYDQETHQSGHAQSGTLQLAPAAASSGGFSDHQLDNLMTQHAKPSGPQLQLHGLAYDQESHISPDMLHLGPCSLHQRQLPLECSHTISLTTCNPHPLLIPRFLWFPWVQAAGVSFEWQFNLIRDQVNGASQVHPFVVPVASEELQTSRAVLLAASIGPFNSA